MTLWPVSVTVGFREETGVRQRSTHVSRGIEGLKHAKKAIKQAGGKAFVARRASPETPIEATS